MVAAFPTIRSPFPRKARIMAGFSPWLSPPAIRREIDGNEGVIADATCGVPTWGGIQDRKTVGTCRGTSGIARRCETACNEGVIADMPRHVPTWGGIQDRKL